MKLMQLDDKWILLTMLGKLNAPVTMIASDHDS